MFGIANWKRYSSSMGSLHWRVWNDTECSGRRSPFSAKRQQKENKFGGLDWVVSIFRANSSEIRNSNFEFRSIIHNSLKNDVWVSAVSPPLVGTGRRKLASEKRCYRIRWSQPDALSRLIALTKARPPKGVETAFAEIRTYFTHNRQPNWRLCTIRRSSKL